MIVVYILIGILLLLLIIAALLPSKYHIEKSTIIMKPRAEVMDKVGNLNNYKEWNPWQRMEPAAKAIISGTPMVPGHQYEWQGKKIGMGNLTLRSIDKKHIHFNLEFLKPWKSMALDNWLFEEWGNNETKVTWQNVGDLPYPVARLMGAYMAKTLNAQFIQGLDNLKKMCEG